MDRYRVWRITYNRQIASFLRLVPLSLRQVQGRASEFRLTENQSQNNILPLPNRICFKK